MSQSRRYGAIEAGGTKVICGWANESGEILESRRIPTTTPDEVTAQVTDFFLPSIRQWIGPPRRCRNWNFRTGRSSPGFTFLRTALKHTQTGLGGCRLDRPDATVFPDENETPIVVDTDVNAAALGEMRWGAARELDTIVYFTVGTGIGGGVVCNGKPLHGLVHPEVGHMRIPRTDPDKEKFPGICPNPRGLPRRARLRTRH